MAFARDDKETVTYIDQKGNIIRYQLADGKAPENETPSLTAHTTQSQLVDLEGEPHTDQEVTRTITELERKSGITRDGKITLHSSNSEQKRPVATSDSDALEADQKTLEEEQLAAYNEDPIFPANVKKDLLSSGVGLENDLYHGLVFNPPGSHSKPENNEAAEETIPALFTNGLPQHILGYWGSDIDIIDSKLSRSERDRLHFFGKQAKDSVFIALAKKVTEAFLGGEEDEVEEAFSTVEKYPELLRCPPIPARDRLGSPDFRVMKPDETETELAKGEKNVYFNRTADGGLNYQLLDHNGKRINDHITPQQLGQEIKEAPPLTLPELNKLRGRILKITAERGHTPLGRLIKNTIIGTLAMASEVDLQEGMEEKEALQKQRGLVERLAAIPGGLSKEEVAHQIEQAVTGDKAQEQTQKRIDRMMAAVKQFAEDILKKANEFKEDKENGDNFPAFQALCQPCIDQFEKSLQHDPNELITAGVIFDELFLHKVEDWFRYGYELCLLPKGLDNEVKLEPGKLYLEEKEGCVAYSVLKPDGTLVRHVKVDEVKAPNPFELDGFNNLRFGDQNEYANLELKDKIFETATESKHIETIVQRFGNWVTIINEVFWVNGYGKLETKLSRRSQDVACHGIGSVEGPIPPERGSRDISPVNSSSGCGVSFYLGCYGWRDGHPKADAGGGHGSLISLCRSKTAALQKLRGNPHSQLRVSAHTPAR